MDYPKDKLQVLLLLEEDDTESLSKLSQVNLPSIFEVIVIPHSAPKTKPKALNYGLQYVKSEYAVIYDAGNVILFWGAFIATAWSVFAIAKRHSWNIAFVLFCLLVQFVAWVPISRVLFFYHT